MIYCEALLLCSIKVTEASDGATALVMLRRHKEMGNQSTWFAGRSYAWYERIGGGVKIHQ